MGRGRTPRSLRARRRPRRRSRNSPRTSRPGPPDGASLRSRSIAAARGTTRGETPSTPPAWSTNHDAEGNSGPTPVGPESPGFRGCGRRCRPTSDVRSACHLHAEIEVRDRERVAGPEPPPGHPLAVDPEPVGATQRRGPARSPSTPALKQQWCRETRIEPIRTSHPGCRPMTTGVSPTTISRHLRRERRAVSFHAGSRP